MCLFVFLTALCLIMEVALKVMCNSVQDVLLGFSVGLSTVIS